MDTQDEMNDKEIVVFDLKGENIFKPAHYPPNEEGLYVTLRWGPAGISQRLDKWKDGEWQLKVLDDSKVIAYSKNKIEL